MPVGGAQCFLYLIGRSVDMIQNFRFFTAGDASGYLEVGLFRAFKVSDAGLLPRIFPNVSICRESLTKGSRFSSQTAKAQTSAGPEALIVERADAQPSGQPGCLC